MKLRTQRRMATSLLMLSSSCSMSCSWASLGTRSTCNQHLCTQMRPVYTLSRSHSQPTLNFNFSRDLCVPGVHALTDTLSMRLMCIHLASCHN